MPVISVDFTAGPSVVVVLLFENKTTTATKNKQTRKRNK